MSWTSNKMQQKVIFEPIYTCENTLYTGFMLMYQIICQNLINETHIIVYCPFVTYYNYNIIFASTL